MAAISQGGRGDQEWETVKVQKHLKHITRVRASKAHQHQSFPPVFPHILSRRLAFIGDTYEN